MGYFLTALRTSLALRLRSLRCWTLLLLLPLLMAAALRALPAREAVSPVQVGVALPAQGGEEFWALLESRSGTVLTFILSDEETIERKIAAGLWDCGLILPEDFEARLEERDLDGSITLKIGPGSAVYPLVQETVAACMAKLASPGIAEAYLISSGILGEEEASAALGERMGEPDRVEVTMTTADGRELAPFQAAADGISGALLWMVSVVVLVWMLLCATDLSRWLQSSGTARLRPLRRDSCLMWPKICADGILACISGWSALAVLGADGAAWAALGLYVLLWMAAAVLLAHFPAVSGALPVCLPFLTVISLLLSSVLVDAGSILPGLAGAAQWLPVRSYLRLCRGDWQAAGALLAAAAVCAGASALLDGRSRT